MGVYVHNMEMPTSCYECSCNKDDGFGFFTCGVTKSECNFTSLPSDCPLVPVPPHGRLIDADAFIKKHFGKEYFDKVNIADEHELGVALTNIPIVFNNTPTIIEAEEGET